MSPWQYLLHSKRSFYEFYLQFLKYQKKKKTIYYTQSEKEIWTPCRVCSLDSRRTEILRSLSWFGYSSGLLSFKKPETVLWTIAKHYYYYYYYYYYYTIVITFEPIKILTHSAPQNNYLNLSFVKDIHVIGKIWLEMVEKRSFYQSHFFLIFGHTFSELTPARKKIYKWQLSKISYLLLGWAEISPVKANTISPLIMIFLDSELSPEMSGLYRICYICLHTWIQKEIVRKKVEAR